MSQLDLAHVTNPWALRMGEPLCSHWQPQTWLGVSEAELFPELYNSQGKDLTGILSKGRELMGEGGREAHTFQPLLGIAIKRLVDL